DRSLVGQVPEPYGAVDGQVQGRLHEVGYVGGRDDEIVGRGEGVTAPQRPQQMGGEIVWIVWGEEGRGADHQRPAAVGQDRALRLGLAAAVDVERAGRVALQVGP